MPELPEVETTRKGIAPLLEGKTIKLVNIYNKNLRWPIPLTIKKKLIGAKIQQCRRRAKYLIIETSAGNLIIHLGMSGHLHICTLKTPRQKHDHFELVLSSKKCLRLNDPRRFGAVLWGGTKPESHKLLADIGPEPLAASLSEDYLYSVTRKRKRNIRDTLLDGKIIAGIGNIYANEALFRAGIRPTKAAARLSKPACIRLLQAIQQVLTAAIEAGGTTLKDFQSPSGQFGYFTQSLLVYGKEHEACVQCGRLIHAKKLGGRRVFYCTNCQR
jgi:formamidopyrimidine-DNA glycosylase